MNTVTATENTQQYHSPLSISTEAVALRDITYPMSAIKSAEVIPVVTNKGSWDLVIFVVLFTAGNRIARMAVEMRYWELQLTPQEWLRLLGTAGAFLALAYFCMWIDREARKRWRYIYAADLVTDYGKTLVAASHDRSYVEHTVATINETLTRSRETAKGTSERIDEGAESADAPVVYDHYFRLDDNSASISGWSVPLDDVRYASKAKLEGRNYQQENWNKAWLPPLYLLGFMTFDTLVRIGGPIFLGIVAVLGFGLMAFSIWKSDLRVKGKVPLIKYIYIVRLGVAGEDVPAIISIDHGFVDKFVTSVQETIKRRNLPSYKRRRATVQKVKI